MTTKTFQGVTYTNGNVPASLLRPLDGQPEAFLRLDAAGSWNRARPEVLAKTGILLTVRGWNRTYAEQVTFYLQRHRKARAGESICCYWNGVPYHFIGTAHAAPPGTSNHGWGLAVDIVDFGSVGQWNNPRYRAAWPVLAEHGWTETEGRGSIQEPWHKVYDSSRDQHKNDKPITTPEDEMPTAKEIADAVWSKKVRTPSNLVDDLGKETTTLELLKVTAWRVERAKNLQERETGTGA